MQERPPDRYGPHGMIRPRASNTSRSSLPLTPALIAMAHGVAVGRSAIRWCRTAAPGHRNRPRSLAVGSCGNSIFHLPSAASPKAGRCARTSCTKGRVLGWRPTPNYGQPPRYRSSRRISPRLPIDDTAPLKSRCAPLALKASVSFLLSWRLQRCHVRASPPLWAIRGGLGKSTVTPRRPGTTLQLGGLRLQSRRIGAPSPPRPRETQADEPPTEPS